MKNLSFTSTVINGAGRGKKLGAPTLNLSVTDVPKELTEGIYACIVHLPEDDSMLRAAMHYGSPIFYSDDPTCEVHILDRIIEKAPKTIRVTVIAYLRPIQNFESEEALSSQIQKDLCRTRAILSF